MSMPKFGVTISPYRDIFNQINAIGRDGFDFVEFSLEEPITNKFISKNKKQLSKLLNKYSLFATAHAPLFTLLATNFEEVKEGWLKVTKNYIKNLNDIKVQKLTFHTYHFKTAATPVKFEKVFLLDFVRSFEELVKFGKKYKIQILVENAIHVGYSEMKYFEYLVNNVQGLGITLDVAHAFVVGGMKNIRNYIMILGNKIDHIHVHDNHGKHDEHLPIGRGKINYISVVKMLKEINYDKTITFEIFTNKRDVVKSREKIKKLWSKV